MNTKKTSLTDEQRAALADLQTAIKAANDHDLFDILVAYCSNSDSINDVCDAVDDLYEEVRSI